MTQPESGLVTRAPMAPSRAPSPGGGLVQMDKAAIMERVKVIHSIMEEVMVEGHHYFTFGTTKRKFRLENGTVEEREVPQFSLGKAGAEVVCLTFGLTPDLDSVVVADDPNAPRTIQISEWVDDPTAGRSGRRKIIRDQVVTGYYEVKSTCAIWSNQGTLLARASGSCNSCETAFVNQGYSNVKNSILKRAEKRAMVAAVLMASGAGDVFVQDLEDTPTAVDPNQGFRAAATQGSAQTGTQTGAQGGSQNVGAAPAGWLSEPQKKLLFAKGKNQAPPASEEVIRHIIHVLDGMPKPQAKPYFDAIADGKPQGAELWAQARQTVETAAAAKAGAGPGGEVPPDQPPV
jgi:hypothetical protein